MSAPRFLSPLAAALIAIHAANARAEPPAIDPSIGRVEAFIELPTETPYVGEPILVRVRSSVRGHVARDDMRQPALTDFDWQQFGIDVETDDMVNGFRVPVFERVIAVYPRKPGRLTIGPFVRHVTLVTADNDRVEADFASEPVTVEARAHDGLGRAGDWWLPARSVKITNSWEPSPDKLGFDDTARRTLTLEASGVTADRLPPPPPVRTEGVIAFVGPVERETIVTDDGPTARAIYRWDVRPASLAPAMTPAIHIPWFDISSRQMRDAVAPSRRVSFLGSSGDARPAPAVTETPSLFSTRPLAAGAASFLWTMAVAFLLASSRKLRLGARNAARRKALAYLRRAARGDDLASFRAALANLSRVAPDHWARVAGDTNIAADLASIDAHMFAASAHPSPRLTPLARAITAACRRLDAEPSSEPNALVPLDGAPVPFHGERGARMSGPPFA